MDKLETTISKAHVPIADRYAGQRCELDGAPATISGRLERFATVRQWTGYGGEWSWPAVERIMEKGGRFFWNNHQRIDA